MRAAMKYGIVDCREGEPVTLEFDPVSWHAIRSRADRFNAYIGRVVGRKLPLPPIQVDALARTVQFNGVGGFVPLGPAGFRIIPKFMDPEDWQLRWARLCSAGARAGRGLVVLPGRIPVRWIRSELVEPLARFYAGELLRAIDAYPLLSGRRSTKESRYLRGRLRIQRQLLKPPHLQGRFSISFSHLSSSNVYTAVLREAVVLLRRLSRTRRTRHQLSLALEGLPPGRQEYYNGRLSDLRLPAGAEAYRYAFRIAKGVLMAQERAVVAIEESEWMSAGVLAVMHDCFEGLVSGIYMLVSQELGLRCASQHPWTLAEAAPGNTRKAPRTPVPDDVLLSHDGRVVLSSDTKYKGSLRRGRNDQPLSPADFYQLVSACLASGADRGLIVQPRVEVMGDEPASQSRPDIWTVQSDLLSTPIAIGTTTLDLRRLRHVGWEAVLAAELTAAVRTLQAHQMTTVRTE